MGLDTSTIIGNIRAVDTYLQQAIGNSITVGYPNSTTETYTFATVSGTDYVLTVVYTDSTKANISTVTRTA